MARWLIILGMASGNIFESRLGSGVDVEGLISRISVFYKLGSVHSFRAIEIGFEDFNVILETGTGKWFVKIFSIERSAADVRRYVNIVEKVIEGGVSHPRLRGNPLLFHSQDYNLYAVCMDYVEGNSFYKRSGPSAFELDKIMEQAVLLHAIDYKPAYIFDSWAVPNIDLLYGKVDSVQLGVLKPLIHKIISDYHQIDIERLSTCFVHGDIIKSNVIMSAGVPYIVDFSCANTYPKIQELAVIAANLLAKTKHETFNERVNYVIKSYIKAGGILSTYEKKSTLPYAKAAVAMELLGSIYDEGGAEDETLYWRNLAEDSLLIIK